MSHLTKVFRSTRTRYGLRSIALLASILFIVCGAFLGVHAQEKNPQRGFQPGNAYALSDVETINTTNGNLMLSLPLGTLAPGRGGVSGGIGLRYSSKLYDSTVAIITDSLGLNPTAQNIIATTEQAGANGGWHYTSPLDYTLEVINRNNVEGGPFNCTVAGGPPDYPAIYIWKVKVIYPDGAEREFRPNGYDDIIGDGYFNVDPNTGGLNSCGGVTGYAPNPLTYYSTDGTYTRLTINHGVGWTLSFPDGSRFEAGRLYDRNNNYLSNGNVTLPNSHVVTGLVDQFGRYVATESNATAREDYIYSLGFNNQVLMWTVKWKTIYVLKPYKTTGSSGGIGHGGTSNQSWKWPVDVVDRITLPSQLGALTYQFSYNAPDYVAGNPEPTTNSVGWGEVSGITLPSGAQTTYQYARDGGTGIGPTTRGVLDNSVAQKTLTYQAEYDGSSNAVSEAWSYSVSGLHTSSTMTAPDGGITTHYFNDTSKFTPTAGLVYREVYPSGDVIERLWQANSPSTATGFSSDAFGNFYVKTEFHSITNASGALVKTAIKDYDYDKNGNVTRTAEYDWVNYGDVPRTSGSPTGIPTSAVLKRVSNSTYWRATPNASDHDSNTADSYWNPSSPTLRTATASSEVGDGSQTLARTEFVYDDPAATGNLTQSTSWDSQKSGYSSPLTTNNSISTTAQYNQYGSPTLTTDARGFQTQVIYGTAGSFSDLYPTQVKTAYGTAVQRTETREYDFNRGLTTRVTDVDNSVATSMDYDVIGRPILVRAAEGKAEETRTSTAYSDISRRVIVRSDLNTVGDAKLVTIQHYDQLGRVRLSRQLEDATTQSATDETQGIKIQTRYKFYGSNSYGLVSHPYRETSSLQAPTQSMDWTRSQADNSGRMIEVRKFGASLPSPWGGNTTGTGGVTTTYDANVTTVMDQAGRLRRSVVNGLGQLVRVDEPEKDTGALDDGGVPIQSTSYAYDAVSNLLSVTQGAQTRSFAYSSLGRLTSATNPESGIIGYQGIISYQYDPNGSLTQKTDARGVVSTYAYDELNRNTGVTYTNDPALTPTVTRTYDGATNGKGKAWKTQTAGATGSLTTIDAYDALGRPLQQRQQFHVYNGWGSDFTVRGTYDRASHLLTQTYPSEHTVTYSYDQAGRTSTFSGNLGEGTNRTYATDFQYTESGAMQQEKFGTDTSLYHKQRYNERGQLWDMRLSTVPFNTDPANGDRGAVVNYYSNNFVQGGTGADNNGNLLRQETYIPASGFFQDNFTYDKLNRLSSITEKLNGTGNDSFKQAYAYDRFGNRAINQSETTQGVGINSTQAAVVANTTTNRLYAPGETETNHPLIDYDLAGNQKKDHYSGNGVSYDRTYDAENRMVSSTATDQFGSQVSTYTYDGNGARVKRKVNGVETWQVDGLGGELLAEYAASGTAMAPQKEYGYRNGQLLITEDAPTTQTGQTQNVEWTNAVGVSVSGNSLTKTASTVWGNAGAASTQTLTSGDGYVEMTVGETGHARIFGFSHTDTNQNWDTVDFGFHCSNHTDNAIYIYESGTERGTFGAYAVGDKLRVSIVGGVVKYSKNGTVIYTSTVTPTYPLRVDAALYENGATLMGGIVIGNLASQDVEWTNAVGVSVSGNSLTKTAATVWGNAGAASTQTLTSGDGYVEMTVGEAGHARIFGFSHSDTNQNWDTIDFGLHCSNHADNAIYVYESGTERGIFGGYAVGDKLRVLIVGGVVKYSRNGTVFYTSTVTPTYPLRVDAALYENGATLMSGVVSGNLSNGGSSSNTQWLVTDQLGTPRMIVDKTGSLANTKRHDYLPFGEELFSAAGGRTPQQGYTADSVRQKFTLKERDIETGLDYFEARYYSSIQGRFTSPDEFTGGPHEVFEAVLPPDPLLYAEPTEPASFNKYNYCLGNPLRYIDPDGHQTKQADALILATPKTTIVTANVVLGVLKEGANVWIGMGNVSAHYGLPGTQYVEPYQASNRTQEAAMNVTGDIAFFGGLITGKAQIGGVMIADAEETAVVAAEGAAGRASSTSQMAGELSDEIGKNSVSYRTPNKVGHIDLKGKSHFDKSTGRSIPTPHVQERSLHMSPGGVRTNVGRQTTRAATKQDIRTARKIIKHRER